MSRLSRAGISILLLSIPVMSQGERITLDRIVESLSEPEFAKEFPISLWTSAVLTKGIAFTAGSDELGRITKAAIAGKHPPEQIPSLLLACLRVCEKCRSEALAPMTFEDVKALFSWGFSPAGVHKEVLARGGVDIPNNESTARALREAGGSDELVNSLAPSDSRPPPPMDGYQIMRLGRVQPFGGEPEGSLHLEFDLPVKGKREFVFWNNALYVKSGPAALPESTFRAHCNNIAPTNEKAGSFSIAISSDWPETKEPKGLTRKPKGAPVEAGYGPFGPNGQMAFRILVADDKATAKRHWVSLSWKPTAP